MKRQILLASVCFLAALTFVACNRQASTGSSAADSDPTEQLPAKFKTQKPVAKPDFAEAAKSPAFQQAIKQAAALLGSRPQPLHSQGENGELIGGVSFDVPQKKLEAILLKAHTNFLAKGFYVFRYDQNYGIGDQPDNVGLLPTADKYAVMAAMETNGDNYDIGTAGVIAWMKELELEQSYVLTGIGFDYMEGFFSGPVKDPNALAKRMYQFCPDIVDQGVGDVSKLSRELQKGSLYLWWD